MNGDSLDGSKVSTTFPTTFWASRRLFRGKNEDPDAFPSAGDAAGSGDTKLGQAEAAPTPRGFVFLVFFCPISLEPAADFKRQGPFC